MAEMVRGERGEGRWRGIIQEQQQSGQNIHDFCRARELGESTFYAWRRRLALCGETAGQSPPPPPANPAAFIPVSVVSTTSSMGRMDILLPGGFRIRVTPPVDGRALAEVLAILTKRVDGSEGQRC
jgi:hypothetical protein